MAITPVPSIDLTAEIQDWKDAACGQEVRAASVSALEKINGSVSATIININNTAETVEQTRQDVETVRQEAADAVTKATASAQTATDKATDAGNSAVLAESWAIGGTGTRDGENTNNAKYYAAQSTTQADRARDEADRAAQYSKITAPGFYFDVAEATIYIKGGAGVSFAIQDGGLYWKVVA